MKIALFTDIHWGAKNNSVLHNSDCAEYIDWFISNFKKEKCHEIVFMGDWFENRNSLNVSTLNTSYQNLKKLDSLNVPIYFCVGNHDLYHRSSRAIYSTYHFDSFKNVIMINEPMMSQHGYLFSPYLFKEEYADLAAMIQSKNPKYVFGHFEFRNFVITGTDRKMDHGPDHTQFTGPTYIFSGHYHKRQALDNVVYIGNTFPTNYGDSWDDSRGMCILDTSNDDVYFLDWDDCPKYRKIKLSSVLSSPNITFPEKCRVTCMIDIDLAYSEAQNMREELIKTLNLREFVLEEISLEKKNVLEGLEEFEDLDIGSLNDAVIKMLQTKVSNTTSIKPEKLIEIYSQL